MLGQYLIGREAAIGGHGTDGDDALAFAEQVRQETGEGDGDGGLAVRYAEGGRGRATRYGGGHGADLHDAAEAEAHAGGGFFGEDLVRREKVGESGGESGEGEGGGGAEADAAGEHEIKPAFFGCAHQRVSTARRRLAARR